MIQKIDREFYDKSTAPVKQNYLIGKIDQIIDHVNKIPKPILVIKSKPLTYEQYDRNIEETKKRVGNDYHVLLVTSNSVSAPELEVLNPAKGKEIDLEGLKKQILDSFK